MKEKIAKILSEAENIFCFIHKNPDGDALGSALAVRNFYGSKVRIFSPTPFPEVFFFLPHAEEIVIYTDFSEIKGADVFLVLDCADEKRVPGFDRKKARFVINIDHHETNTFFGDLNFVDPDRASTAELVLEVLREAGEITKPVADCIYTGLYTDTGGFRFSNTNKKAFETASFLLERGVNPSEIASAVYENYPLRRFRLLSLALSTLELELGGRVAVMHVTRDMLSEAGASDEDTEDFVNYTRSIKGVEVGIFMRELSGGGVKISLRSKGGVNVAEVAKRFGGGGHFSAAGCELKASLPEARALLLAELSKVL